MRALQFFEYGSADVLRVAEIPEPHPGPGEIRIAVRSSGVTPADWKLRSGAFQQLIPLTLPHTLGIDAAGVVDEIGDGVTGVAVGDEVYGMASLERMGGANADFAILTLWGPKPAAWSWDEAGGAAGNTETSVRVLDLLAIGSGDTLLIEGAAGGVGSMAVQLARARGARVIGTASAGNHEFLAGLGATPVTYGPGLAGRLDGPVDAVFDCAGSGSLAELVAIAGGPARVVTIADFTGAEHGVRMSRTGGPGAEPQSRDALTIAAAVPGLTVPLAGVFALEDAAGAHRLSETGHVRGKVVLRSSPPVS
ncbi:NADP-dependent oxidoreductase [Actinoplanes couchii]|uniref:Oxidoreductase n=1 Tax=Actinoplanes couchii TaxID=403638 RepID=A0ABQ3XCS0_9ACTN|nr:NADP-dependent oxidoreductase [Actinoplanes couchii]MDR6321196.1 NADPH:quinone reductase-like Zn-dependent oxidoreductase [Actinoplanes couchii]GID56304.1 oxidoreductase [Actinoplanes couchii]